MDGQDFFVIASPASGRGQGAARIADLVASLRSRGGTVGADLTTSLDHATELAHTHAKPGVTVVAVGGDGLVTAVVNGVADVKGGVMGIIPMGTGNDFARSLGITSRNAIDVVLTGDTSVVDLGRVGDRYFTCIASVGFDSMVVENAQRSTLFKGPLLYPWATVKSLLTWQPATFTVETEGTSRRMTGMTVAASNSGVYGGGMRLVPDADMSDGLLDLVMISCTSRLGILRQVPNVFAGSHVSHPDVHISRVAEVVLDSDQPFTVYADGEAVGPVPQRITAAPSALRVRVPLTS
jgi:YegS/Rv2252/BmrU family lipid kinase